MPADPPPAPAAASPLLPVGLILILGNLWGLSFSLSKIAGMGGVSPVAYAFWQVLGAGGILLAVSLLRGRRPPVDRAHLRAYFVLGIVGIVIPNVNMVMVVIHLPAGVAVLTIPFVPLTTYVIALALRMERFDLLRLAGVLFGFGGAALILLPKASLPSADLAPWFLLGLLTPLCYAASNVLAERLRPAGAHSLPMAAGMLCASTMVLAPAVIVPGVFYPLYPPFEAPELAILGQIAISTFAYVIFFEIVRLVGPVYMSVTGYVVTLTGIGWGILIFGESHSPWVWGATVLIFAGMALVNLRRRAAVLPAGADLPDPPSRQ